MRVVLSQDALRVTPCAEADARVVDAARRAAAITIDQGFDPSADEGHALRVAARVLTLAKVQRSRFDSEVVEQVDLEVQSDAAWKRWCRSLSPPDLTALKVWRGGAVKTHTRRWYLRDASRQGCTCGAAEGSARHRLAECSELAALRARLSTQFAIPPGWWLQQPRVLSKSGWITQDAGISHAQRVQRQIAACTLGIAIAKMGDLVAEDSWSVLLRVSLPRLQTFSLWPAVVIAEASGPCILRF